MLPKIILMRHGESAWNKRNLFTGWVDIPLSEKGIQESIDGGKQMSEEPIDLIFTSSLVRAHMTLILAMMQHKSGKVPVFLHPKEGKLEAWSHIYSEEAEKETIPVYEAWELNERMYGRLQGLNKEETAKKFSDEQVHLWRRSYNTAPPDGESLEMTAQRTLPYFRQKILPHLELKKSVFVCAHGNSLRSIIMEIEKLTPDQVVKLELATGEPRIYSYGHGYWKRL